MTETYELGVYGACDGNILPTGCSGLAIVSRYPFQEVWLILNQRCQSGSESSLSDPNTGTVKRGKIGHILTFKSKLKICYKVFFGDFFARKVCMNYETTDCKA
jgi:hypothetical protein